MPHHHGTLQEAGTVSHTDLILYRFSSKKLEVDGKDLSTHSPGLGAFTRGISLGCTRRCALKAPGNISALEPYRLDLALGLLIVLAVQ
jgi:hypothetical protein